MKTLIYGLLLLAISLPAHADDPGLDGFLTTYDYVTRKDMKIDSKALIELLKEGKAQLIDIRFEEEYAAWHVAGSKSIPLNELPKRWKEIDTGKIVVTACPHKDRATIAMTYLRSKGVAAKYLTDGLTGMVENLRGDSAKAYMDATH